MTSGRRAARIVQSGMVIAAAVAALSMAAISRTPNSQLPAPNTQQASWELGVGSWESTSATQGDQSSGAAPATPIPVERIREALQRPPALTIPPLPEPTATFRSGVEDTPPFESVLEGMRRDLALWNGANSVIHPPGSGLPSSRLGGGVDVLPLISAAVKQWKTARARDRVNKELAAFCAVNDCSVLEAAPSPPEGIVRPPAPRP